MAHRAPSRSVAIGVLLTFLASWPLAAGEPRDPLAGAIAGLQARITSATPVDDETKQIRAGFSPLLDQAAKALAQGQRWLALSRLALVWPELRATEYRAGIASELRGQMAQLEREWQRLGPELAKIDAARFGPKLDGLPAAARAIGEAALSQIPVYYQASLDYGRNTAPEYGLFYLGAARAQLELAGLVSDLAERPAGVAELAPRDLTHEIAAITDELLAVYAPPLSVDSHTVFIRVSALLKEAEELAAAGARYGALFRLLDARARLSRLTHPGRAISSEEAERRAKPILAALASSPADTSLQRLFLETALFSAADPDPAAGGGEIAAAIFENVLPWFPVALGPAPPRPPDREAEATVTLVRWPYT